MRKVHHFHQVAQIKGYTRVEFLHVFLFGKGYLESVINLDCTSTDFKPSLMYVLSWFSTILSLPLAFKSETVCSGMGTYIISDIFQYKFLNTLRIHVYIKV